MDQAQEMKEDAQTVQEASSQQAVHAAQLQQRQEDLQEFWNSQVKIIDEIDPSQKPSHPQVLSTHVTRCNPN
jgi:hypothetical protein